MLSIEKQRFVCIDCETTGLDPQQDHVIEVAAMCFDAHQVYAQMEALINPECPIPETSIAIHHITQEMVESKPTIAQVLPDLLKLIDDYIIVGHGVKFDIEILAVAAERHRIPCTIRNNRYLDTLRMARYYGESPINSLKYLCKHFNIPLEDSHRAMSDVVVNCEIFKRLAKGFKTTEELFATLAKPILMAIMPLGKYKGREMKTIPLQYLQSMANKDYFDEDLRYSIRMELKRRKKGDSFSQAGNPFLNLS